MVRRWLTGVLGADPGAGPAGRLIGDLADELGHRWQTPVSRRDVDHTVWRLASGRGLPPAGE